MTIKNGSMSDSGEIYGGGIYNTGTSLYVSNCTITGNSADYGGGIYNIVYNNSAILTLYNTIVAGNSTDIYRYSNTGTIHGFNNLTSFTGWTGSFGSNLVYDSSKPLFVDAANGNYRLAANSQAIDKGNNSYVPSSLTKDLAGSTRIQNGTVDIGAYEYSSAPASLGVPQVTLSQSNGSVTLTWAAIPTATHYGIYRMVNGKWTVVNANVTATTFTENSAPVGTQMYAVRAFKGTVYSDYQQGVTINVVPAGLGVPQVNISQSNGNVTLTWAAIPTATHYGVYRMVNGKWTVVNANVAATTFTENNVPTGSQTYAVRAFKGTTMSDYQTGVTINVVPADLGVPQVNISQSNGNVTLTWAAIPTATHYGVYRMVNGKWTVVNANVTATTFTEYNVPTGTQTYAVRAFKGTVMSDYQAVLINI